MYHAGELPYLKTVKRKVKLNPGKPLGRGCITFLFANTPKDSISMIQSKKNLESDYHRFYFYQPRYKGSIRIGGIGDKNTGTKKIYHMNHMKEQDIIYKHLEEETDVSHYRVRMEINQREQRNLYFDLSGYMSIYHHYGDALPFRYKLNLFWEIFKPVLTNTYGELGQKSVVINAELYPYQKTGKIADRINNPLYLIYFTLYKNFDTIKDLDIDFYAYANDRVLRFNPAKCDAKSHLIFLRELRKLYANAEILATTEKEIVEEISTEEYTQDVKELKKEEDKRGIPVVVTHLHVASKTKLPSGVKEIPITKRVNKAIGNVSESSHVGKILEAKAVEAEKELLSKKLPVTEEAVAQKIEEKVEMDEQLIGEIYNNMIADKKAASARSTARDQMLREKQKDLIVKGMTLEDLSKINPKETKIDKIDVSPVIKTTNPNMRELKFQNFNESYTKKVMSKDIMGVFEDLNNKSLKMFILDVDVQDSSDVLNYKETWTIHLEDENRNRHTIKVDIPKFVDKNFMWLGGNKKVIKNQDFFLPVVKISEDTVLIVANYNKMTLKRVDGNSLKMLTLMDKRINNSEVLQSYFIPGSARIENASYITTLEYDEYGKKFFGFKSGRFVLWFSQKEAEKQKEKKGIIIPKNNMLIGVDNNTPIFLDIDTQKTTDGKSISELILDHIPENEVAEIRKLNVPKRLMYTKVTTMSQDVPIGVLLCLWEGLGTVLKKAEIKFRLTDRLKDIRVGENYIRFKNCFLVYEATIPAELLLNGLNVIDTKAYEISEMDEQVPYLPFIEKKYGKLSILNALNNVYEFTISNIEREILTDIGLPTDLVSLIIYANSLLADNQFVNELDQSLYRIRNAEIIPAILYDSIAKAYVPFKNSNGKKKLSIPQDIVIRKMLALTTVEDYSSLNPFLELETTHGVSTKGWRGVNLEQCYTIPKRSYDKSMTGIIGISSSPDGQVGVNRCLTMEPSVNSVRGYVDIKADKLDELKDVNLFSPAEMLIPMGVINDDPIRTGHSVKQSRASVPIKEGSPVLISNGADEICKYYLSSDFVVNAEQDGTVIEIDEETKIMVVEYKDGSHHAINLDKNLVKNGGGGFELSNVLITDLKVGEKFKANETLAWHKNFFKKIPEQGVRMCVGALVKVALYSSYNTYEDANFITNKVAHMCETEMCFRIPVSIGRNSNVFDMVSVGDEVAVGDPLIEFDESFEESDINKLLSALGQNEELKETVVANSRNYKKSKYSGVIEEIKIYCASEIEDLSPSLQKIVKKYYNRIDKKKKLLTKYDKNESIVKCKMMMTESSGKTEADRYGNIRGVKVEDGVLIEFYVKHAEPLEIGSKTANFGPLKNIVGEIIPVGYEPFSEFRPEEEVSTIISPSSILARMVVSVIPTMFGNKCIVELKRALAKIWTTGGDLGSKRKSMTVLIYRFFSAIDASGTNTKKYKELFDSMPDAKFKSFFTEFFSNPDHYLILDIVDYEHTVTVEDCKRAAKVLGIPLFEKVAFRHYNMDAEHPIVTKEAIATGYLHLKRPQQTVMKKNGMSTSADQRSAFTGQVTGGDKNGRESDLENSILVSLGMVHSLKELNSARADDGVMKKEMLQSIATKGYVRLADLTDDVENKTTLNTVNTYFYGMHLNTDLVSKGLRLPYVTKEEK